MSKQILIKKLNDNYYTKYKYVFNFLIEKFNLINNYILFNLVVLKNNRICNHKILYSYAIQTYVNILFKNITKTQISISFINIIIEKYIKNNILVITNGSTCIHKLYENKIIFDVILYNNNKTNNNLPKLNNKNNIIYSSYNLNIYKQFLINLKNNNEKNNISIPKQKYDLISCLYQTVYAINLTASYKMMLEIPNIISSIAMSLKCLEKNGTLLLFWTIVNINIPIIKKILSLLSYGFKNVEIIDNDINQNLLIGVPEYYIKCSGYKDNISNELINKLLDIAIETIEYTYDVCDVLDYYDDYTKNNPNHSLFYNKIEKEDKTKDETTKSSLTKKISRHSPSHSLTKKASSHSTTYNNTNTNTKSNIKPIYYIEDINIPELDKIMKDNHLQFEVAQLMNKLESIFVGYFKMVNNLILNAITKDKNGNLVVKKEAIIQKDITNLTKLITMFEYNKLPYNKHALNVVLNKQDEILDHFYSLDTPVNQKLIKYEDRTSKMLVKRALEYFNDYNTDSKLHSKLQTKLQSKSS